MVTSRILFTAKQKDELWERWKNGRRMKPSRFGICTRGSVCESSTVAFFAAINLDRRVANSPRRGASI